MTNHRCSSPAPIVRFASVACGALLLTSACAASDATEAAVTAAATVPDDAAEAAAPDAAAPATAAPSTATSDSTAPTAAAPDESVASDTTAPIAAAPDESVASDTTGSDTTGVTAVAGCDEAAALFVTRGSANADLDDPEVSASCEGDSIVVTSNGIPDYTYIGTSPGSPTDRGLTFTIPASPTIADDVTDVPVIGTAGVTLGGIPIFGPTEGTGGDVESLPGILSDCGSHNGPSGFHIHLILTSSETDCLFTPAEVAAEPQLVGYAFDGFPIYTGIDQYTSSWELTDETLFATDTWAAHSFVEGAGDLDQCNGLTDADGNYAYYTTATFPYVLGCYAGVVDLDAAGGGGGGGSGGGGGGGGEAGDRPERPEGDADGSADRPERPSDGDGDGGGDGQERPERPDAVEGGEDE